MRLDLSCTILHHLASAWIILPRLASTVYSAFSSHLLKMQHLALQSSEYVAAQFSQVHWKLEIRSAIPTFTQQFLSRPSLALILFRDLTYFDNVTWDGLHKELKHVNIARILDVIVCQLNVIAIVKEGDSWMWKMSLERTSGSNAPAQSTTSLECQNQTQYYFFVLQILSQKYNFGFFHGPHHGWHNMTEA